MLICGVLHGSDSLHASASSRSPDARARKELASLMAVVTLFLRCLHASPLWTLRRSKIFVSWDWQKIVWRPGFQRSRCGAWLGSCASA